MNKKENIERKILISKAVALRLRRRRRSLRRAGGTIIRSNKYPEIDGKILDGKQILEIPSNNRNFGKIQEYIDLAKNKYNIEIRFRDE
jgi:hypothetical protein